MASDYFASALECHARGNLREAERLYRAHLNLDHQDGGALQGLGIVLAQQGKFNDAVLLLRRALAGRPDSFEVHSNLGVALLALGRAEEAAEHFAKALELNPKHAEALNGLGLAQGQLGRREEALAYLRKAVAVRPDFAQAHANIGVALRELGRPDEARAACERAIAAAPDSPAVYFELARANAELGDLAAAEAAYDKALRAAPMRTDIHRQLAQIKQYAKGDRHLEQMLALASQRERLSLQAQMDLDFAIGKALIDAGDQERALVHLHKANAVVRRRIEYDEPATVALFDRMRAAFADFPAHASGDSSPLPIFVVGMPRSGTTLAEQILASHPQVFGAGELDYFENAAMAATSFSGASSITSGALADLGASYVARIKALAPAAARIVDKMPANFRFAGLIHRALPNAKIIHMRRNPVDTCMSCYAQLFAGLPFAYDLGELGRYYRAYAALMAHWRQVLPPGAMLEVDYERLVGDLPGEARRMISYCGLEWHDACLQHHLTQRTVRTASFAQVRRPVYRTSIGRWEAHRSALKPLIDALG